MSKVRFNILADFVEQYNIPVSEIRRVVDLADANEILIDDHIAATDPHTQYFNESRGDTRYVRNIALGSADGVATLDSNSKITYNQIPDAALGGLSYQGSWNADTNTPSLFSGQGIRGYFYKVDVSGSTDLDGITDWKVGDWAIFDGTNWQKIDQTEVVLSVNSKTGTVILDTDDINEGATNLYYTEQRASDAAPVQTVFGRTGAVVAETSDYDASQIDYDNTQSGLIASDTKAAVDEVQQNIVDHINDVGDPHSQYTTTTEAANAAPVQSVNSQTGVVVLDKVDVGLGNVPNTDATNASNLSSGSIPAARFTDTSHGSRSGGALHSNATTVTAGFMSSGDKTKLNGISTGAEVNAVDSVNNQTGAVVLDTDDINEGATNLYYTSARASGDAPVQSVDGLTGAVSLNYDNYGGWGLLTDGTNRGTITSGENVNFVGGTNVSLAYSATNNTLTFSATANDTNFYLNGMSFDQATGILTATVNGAANQTVDLDGRYATGDNFDSNGTYAGLRAQSTTQGDVGLGNVRNVSSYSQTEADANFLGINATADNADLLDNQNGTYYLNFNNFTNIPDPTLTLNGDVSGSATFTDLGNATLTVTVNDDSHNHIISNVDGLQTALDSKVDQTSFDDFKTREELLKEATFTADFANNTYVYYDGPVNDRIQTTFKDVFDFTRNSKANARNATNGVTEVAVDDQRLVGNREGLLIEEARTNLLEYPRQFDNASWAKTDSTVIPDETTAPDGAITADKLVEGTGSGGKLILQSGLSVTAGTSYSFSVFGAAAERDYLAIEVGGATFPGATADRQIIFNVSSGVVELSGASFDNVEIEQIGEYYRCTGTITASTTAATYYAIYVTNSASQLQYTGNGTSGVYIWHAQVEEGSFATSPIVPDTTFTSRSTTSTFLDSNGTLQTASVDVARDDAYGYDSNGVLRPIGLLLEDSATNELINSEDLSAWFIIGSGVTLTETSFGSVARWEIESTATADSEAQVTQSYDIPRFDRVVSAILEEGTARYGVLTAQAAGAGYNPDNSRYVTALVDFQSQTVTTYSDNANLNRSSFVFAGGKCFIEMAFDFATSLTTGLLLIAPSDSVVGHAYRARAAGTTVFAISPQLEINAAKYATSYIPTAGTAVTRAADVSSSPVATREADDCSRTLGAEYNSEAFTVYVEYEFGFSGLSGSDRLFTVSDGTIDNRVAFTGTNVFYEVDNGGVTFLSTSPDLTQSGKAALVFDGENLYAATNGAESLASTSTNIQANVYTQIELQATKIKDFRIIPRAPTATELETLTGGN